MAARQAIQVVQKTVKPVLSTNHAEAKKLLLSLYKAWYREVPYIIKEFDNPKSEEQCRAKLKELFLSDKDVTDVRVIGLLIINGQMELKESGNMSKEMGHIMTYFEPTEEPKPKHFLSKFFNSNE